MTSFPWLQVDRDRLNAVNLHEGEYRGPIDGKGMEKDQVHAPMQPNALPQPDGQLQGPILDQQVHNEGGQMERPNLVPPMVNNMNQEDQVTKQQAFTISLIFQLFYFRTVYKLSQYVEYNQSYGIFKFKKIKTE